MAVKFVVVQQTDPNQFRFDVQQYLDWGYGFVYIGPVKGSNLTTHIAYMSKED